MDLFIEQVKQGRLCHENTNGHCQQATENQGNELAFVTAGDTLDQGPVYGKDDATHKKAQETSDWQVRGNGTEKIGPGKSGK